MVKHRHPITTIILTLIAASACERLPLSLGQGIDALSDPRDPSGSNSAGGATSVGGASGFDDCNASYVRCLETGESPEICRDELDRCATTGPVQAGGASGGGGPSQSDCNASYVRCLETGESPEICREDLTRCEQPGQGAGGSSASGDD
jgi:hypothetical protein